MPASVGYSVLLHLAMIIIMAVGLPYFFKPDTDLTPTALTVEIVPITDVTNLKLSQKRVSEKPAPAPKAAAKPTPKTAKPKPAPAPKPDAVPLPDPDKKAEPEKKKPEPPKKPEKEKTDPKKEQEDDEFAVLMSKLKNDADKADEKEKPVKDATPDTAKSKSDTYDASKPLSISEKDAIRGQFVKCWRMPAGARDDFSLAVRVRVLVNSDGTVREVGLVPDQVSRYQSDTFFRAAADSALRAVQLCSPLKGLSTDKYETWKDMELNFDPQEMLY